MDPGDLKSKHTVFLCHSGAQKGFVAQLDKDLRSADRYPFFDRDRDSLPIGDNFPDLIFKAIEECQVGVVILSEEFFTRSHWPMFEVVKMVECGRKIMPVFLGISPDDLSNKEKLLRWKSEWQDWKESNKRIDISKWEETLRCLRPLNGLVYKHTSCVVEFRDEIVKEICKIVPAFHRWDDSHVQGKSRLSKVIQEKIAETPVDHGVRVVGLYGVGGIGKTTACKSLCNDLSMEFSGRVCYVEFGNDTTQKERVQEVLKRLTSTNNEFLRDKNLDECWSRLTNLMQMNKVFLAIDNVSSNSKVSDEARKYLELKYFQGSVVMVTARALGELEYLGIDSGNSFPMPELVEDEARELFLHYARFKNKVDEGVIMRCIKRCYFGKGAGESGHYHPLALKVLGSQMVGRDSREWESQLEEEDVFNQRREQEHPVFSILRRSFDELLDEDKVLFMDFALIDVKDHCYSRLRNDSLLVSFSDDDIFFSLKAWLSIVHGLSVKVLKERLNGLKRRALLEEVGDSTTKIGMHDLWREFAEKETKRGEQDRRSWVYEAVEGEGEDSCLSGGGWKKLRRICIIMKEGRSNWYPLPSVKCVEFSDCSNVTVLKLVRVDVENQELDLSPLRHLKSLEIVPCQYHAGSDTIPKVSGIGQLTNLAVLIWFGISFASLSAVGDISRLRMLQVLQLECSLDQDVCTMLALDELRLLREVRIQFWGMVTISGFSSRMSKLRMLDLMGCGRLRSCPGVGDVVVLEALSFSSCRELEELPNLQRLTKLRILRIDSCRLLKALPGLGSLVALQELCTGGCTKLDELADISRLTNLEVLDLSGCESLRSTPPGFGNLVALQACAVHVASLNSMRDLWKVTKFDRLVIGTFNKMWFTRGLCCIIMSWIVSDEEPRRCLNLAGLNVSTLRLERVVQDFALTNLSTLTALKSLDVISCSLERLPDMGKDMTLESLTIHFCKSLRGWDGVGRLGCSESQTAEVDRHCDWILPHLQRLDWVYSGVVELPDLSHFPRLRTLNVYHGPEDAPPSERSHFAVHCRLNHVHLEILIFRQSPISELPDLREFPSLKELKIDGCDNLTSLTCSEPLLALESLSLEDCRSLVDLPSFDLFPGLRSFKLQQCGVRLNALEVENLRARCSNVFVDGDGDSEPPEGPSGSEVSSDSESNHDSGSSVRESVPGVESDCHPAMQVAPEGPNHLHAAGPSSVQEEASCSSEFVPYNESISELGLVPTPHEPWSCLAGCGSWLHKVLHSLIVGCRGEGLSET